MSFEDTEEEESAPPKMKINFEPFRVRSDHATSIRAGIGWNVGWVDLNGSWGEGRKWRELVWFVHFFVFILHE